MPAGQDFAACRDLCACEPSVSACRLIGTSHKVRLRRKSFPAEKTYFNNHPRLHSPQKPQIPRGTESPILLNFPTHNAFRNRVRTLAGHRERCELRTSFHFRNCRTEHFEPFFVDISAIFVPLNHDSSDLPWILICGTGMVCGSPVDPTSSDQRNQGIRVTLRDKHGLFR